MSELTEKEKALQMISKEVTFEQIREYPCSSFDVAFNKAWDIQQSKIDELVKALEDVKMITLPKGQYTRDAHKIAHEALEKYRGEKK